MINGEVFIKAIASKWSTCSEIIEALKLETYEAENPDEEGSIICFLESIDSQHSPPDFIARLPIPGIGLVYMGVEIAPRPLGMTGFKHSVIAYLLSNIGYDALFSALVDGVDPVTRLRLLETEYLPEVEPVFEFSIQRVVDAKSKPIWMAQMTFFEKGR